MTVALNTCPATIRHLDKHGESKPSRCGGWLRFVGISIHKTFGWRRWAECASPYCGLWVAFDENGSTKVIQKAEPSKHLFRSGGE